MPLEQNEISLKPPPVNKNEKVFSKGDIVFVNALFGAKQILALKNVEYSFGGYNLVYLPCFAILFVLDEKEYLHKKNEIHVIKCSYKNEAIFVPKMVMYPFSELDQMLEQNG